MKIIQENQFVIEPVSDTSNLYNLTFYKRVKKQSTGQYEMELGNTLYGLTLASVISRIAKHRTAKKYEEENISFITYLKELNKSYKEILAFCKESLPEKFDTGE